MTPAIDPTDLYFPFDHTDYKHAYLDLRARIKKLAAEYAYCQPKDCKHCAEFARRLREVLGGSK